jgi:hypothetical protein
VSANIWSAIEKTVAQEAFKKAYERETNDLIDQLSEKIKGVDNIDAVWEIHDYLSAKRHQIDGRYYLTMQKYLGQENDYSALVFLFADLLKEKWLLREDLSGLSPDKISKISALSYL